MADNETYVDEYQFVDPDIGNTDAMDYTPNLDNSTSPESEKPRSIIDRTFAGRSGVVRNVLIVLVLIIIIMVVYPFINSALTAKKTQSMISAVPQPTKLAESVVPRAS